MLAIVLIALSLLNLDSALGQECGGPLSDTPFDDILIAAQYYSRCTFPAHKFNVNCLLLSCPSVSGVCPLTSTRSINQTSLTSAVSILNTCIRQNGLICNINMSHVPMVQLGWTTMQLIPVSVVNGTVNLNPGTGYVENLSMTTFTLQQNENNTSPITLVLQALNIITKAKFNCTFDIAPTSFLNPLKGIIPVLNSLNMPNVNRFLRFNITATITIDLTTPTIRTINDQFSVYLAYSNFISTNGVALDQNLVDLFNLGMNTFIRKSVVPSTVTNFLSTYVAIGLQAAQLNCP